MSRVVKVLILCSVVITAYAFTEVVNDLSLCWSLPVTKMRANFVRNAVILLVVLFFHAYSAFPSRPDDRTLANNEKYQLLKDLMPSLRQIIAEDKFMEEKRNQEVMTAFNNMKELKDILRSG